MTSARVTACAALPKTRFDNPSLRITTASPPGVESSDAVNARPTDGGTPRTWKYRSDTSSPQIRSDAPLMPMLNASGCSATASANTARSSRMSTKSGYENVKYWKPRRYEL